MKIATSDRGEIVHFAGFHRLSPALREGAPAFAGAPESSLRRCGWEQFFHALETRGLALVYDPENPGSAGFVPQQQAEGLGRSRDSLRRALQHSARFVRALVRRRR